MKEEHLLLHPILVHFPIAFYFLELLLILFWIFKKDESYRRFALFSFRLGYLLMLAAMAAGYLDAGGLKNITGDVRKHAFAALSVFTLSTIRALYWRFAKPEQKNYRWILLGLEVLNYAAVIVTGDLGGDLVYGG